MRVFQHQMTKGIAIAWFALVALSRAAEAPGALDLDSVARLGRQYLTSSDEAERKQLATRLSNYPGDIDQVIQVLSRRSYAAVKPGYYAEETFQSAALREKYSEELLYFVVPKSYDPKRPTGLIVFLHGGGLNTSRYAPMYTLRPGDSESSDEDDSGKMLAATGMITVGPSAPGAFHHAQRQPDRFAAIISSSGAWDWGYWPVVRGTPLAIVSGANDAQRDVRWHHTDVEYGRQTARILKREQLDHKYYEHDGEHSFGENRQSVADYFASAKGLRRDPYYPHIAIATPQGFTYNYLHPVRHNRWLTLEETTPGDIRVDELVSRGRDFDEWRLVHRRTLRPGAVVEAINQGQNRIEVTTQNVARFTLWLHPKMVNLAKPLTIAVDGKPRVISPPRPSLAVALESYERRHDWGLIYPVKLELSMKPGNE